VGNHQRRGVNHTSLQEKKEKEKKPMCWATGENIAKKAERFRGPQLQKKGGEGIGSVWDFRKQRAMTGGGFVAGVQTDST